MLNKIEDQITPEEVFLNRRKFLKAAGFGATALSSLSSLSPLSSWATDFGNPAKRNPQFDGKELKITDQKWATTYNNFYEFSLDKDGVHKAVSSWNLGKWSVEIGGLVTHPKVWDAEELAKTMGVEERVYRFRCVEAWSMVIPWTGFPLAKLLDMVGPKPEAKFVKFTTFNDRKIGTNMSGLFNYPWPYVEGLTLAEARNPLALIATGHYGKPLPKQNGAPIRLVVPWKYGFKSIKSIVKIELVKDQPKGLWEALAPNEYGFYANVNPDVSHPRWSQATERVIDGSFFPKHIPTLKFNGYEKEVASLYAGLDLKKNY